jgi:prolyl oligopeptidase
MGLEDDPYAYLEDIEGRKSLDFAASASEWCVKALGDPVKSKSYSRILGVLESDERIPFISKMGRDSSGNDILYNLWKDSKVCRVYLLLYSLE